MHVAKGQDRVVGMLLGLADAADDVVGLLDPGQEEEAVAAAGGGIHCVLSVETGLCKSIMS